MNAVFSQKFLNRIKRRTEEGSRGDVSKQQSDTAGELVRQARAAGHGGPLVVGPARSSLKGSWRDEANWLEENFAEDFGEPTPARKVELSPAIDATSSDISQSSESAPAAELQCLPLPAAFWWGLLFGSPDSLLSAADSTGALQLISDKLGVPTVEGETLGVLRAGQLRKLLRERFGPLEAEQGIAALWRRALASEGLPQPAEDQSQLPPGPFPVGRAQPAWIRDLHDPDRCEHEWLLDHGIG
jgi:hypothetical protein